ncbi:MAG: XRE family transcriptional regulator [Alphaproteobacteria bacterium]|nr:XRE family transcriptional regulator [Alphaproteobacteria bacterium]
MTVVFYVAMRYNAGMALTIKPRIISRDGQQFALLNMDDFQQLMALAGAKATLPPELSQRLKDGEHPVRLFRRLKKMTQAELAEKAGIARPYLTEIETGKKQGSIPVLKAIAGALGVELNDIS